MEVIPNEILCYTLSYVTNASVILNLWKVNTQFRDMARYCINRLNLDVKLPIDLILSLRSLVDISGFINVNNVIDLILLADLPKLKSININYDFGIQQEYCYSINSIDVDDCVNVQFQYYLLFINQYVNGKYIEDNIIKYHSRQLIDTSFMFNSNGVIKKLKLNNNNNVLLLKSLYNHYIESYTNQLTSLPKYINIDYFLTDLIISGAINNSFCLNLKRLDLYVTYDIYEIEPDLFVNLNVLFNSGQLRYLKINYGDKVLISELFDELIAIIRSSLKNANQVAKPVSLDIPFPIDVIDDVVNIYPNILLFGISAENTNTEDLINIITKYYNINIHLYFNENNIEQIGSIFLTYNNVKILSYFDDNYNLFRGS